MNLAENQSFCLKMLCIIRAMHASCMLPWLASNSSGNEQAPGQASIGVEGLVNRVAKSCSYMRVKGHAWSL